MTPTRSGRTFAEIESLKKGHHKGCPRCGAEKNAGSVAVHLQAHGPTGSITNGRRVTSRSISLCESCCVEVYQAALAFLVNETKANPS